MALTFDLQDGEHEIAENQNVRAVICEHFFIGDDDDDVVFTVKMFSPEGHGAEEEGADSWWETLRQDSLDGRGEHHSGQWFGCNGVPL